MKRCYIKYRITTKKDVYDIEISCKSGMIFIEEKLKDILALWFWDFSKIELINFGVKEVKKWNENWK